MTDANDPTVIEDTERDLHIDLPNVPSADDLQQRIDAGEITEQQAADELQQAARRQTAENGPALDTDEDGHITSGGFGAGQGMAKQSTRHGAQ